MPGSMRRRGTSWELRAYAGTDPETGKRRWVTAPTKSTRRAAERELAEFVARVDYPRRMTAEATVCKLLEDLVQGHVAELISDDGATDTERHRLPPRAGPRRRQAADASRRAHRRLLRRASPRWRAQGRAALARHRAPGARRPAPGSLPRGFAANSSGSIRKPRCHRRRGPAPIYPPCPEEVVRLLAVAAIDPDFHTFLALAVSTGLDEVGSEALSLVRDRQVARQRPRTSCVRSWRPRRGATTSRRQSCPRRARRARRR